MRLIATVLLVLWSLGLSAQSKEYEKKLDQLYSKTVPLITSEQLVALQNSRMNFILLDTRQAKEFEVSHIKGAILADERSFQPADLEVENIDVPIVVYCSVGYRSEKLGERLLEAGFTNVRNLYGGVFQWVNEENEVVDGQDRKTQKVHTYSKSWSVWLNRGVKIYE